MPTTEINLARALKVKNRLAGRLTRLDADLQTYNTLQEGAERPDVKALYAERAVLVRHLIDLKTAINAANAPVQRTIYELAECKALIAVLGKLNTTHGKIVEGYHGKEIQYIAHIRKEEVNREVHRLEREVDRLQDQLDTFNHRTTITVDSALLDGETPAG
jgi:hypothetical protein